MVKISSDKIIISTSLDVKKSSMIIHSFLPEMMCFVKEYIDKGFKGEKKIHEDNVINGWGWNINVIKHKAYYQVLILEHNNGQVFNKIVYNIWADEDEILNLYTLYEINEKLLYNSVCFINDIVKTNMEIIV